MRSLAAFAVGLAAFAASAQTVNQNEPAHIQTALNHLTVLDPGEPIVMFALADHTSFQVEQRENKLFLQPLSANVATNLFIWTASRELTYEVDPAGDITKMNMLVVSPPTTGGRAPGHGVSVTGPQEEEFQRLSAQARNEAILGTENITDDEKSRPGDVLVKLEGIFRSKDQVILKYSIHNFTSSPFRITSPDIFEFRPSKIPISLLSLRNHQLADETLAQFNAVRGQQLTVSHSEVLVQDLAPGESTVGIVGIRCTQSTSPQLYQMVFGSAGAQDISVAVVM